MTYRHLLDLADEGSLARGRTYAAEGRVAVRSTGPGGVVAVATGTQEYDLALDGSGGRCTCPVGLRDAFCKHLVALALVLDGPVGREAMPTGAPLRPARTARLMPAPTAAGDVSTLGPLVDSLRVRGHLDYDRANRHGEEAHEVVDVLEESLSPTTADALLPLLERSIDHLTRAILRSDDSSGIQGDAIGRLFDLHERAAALGTPDPARLGRWMVKVGFADHGFWDIDPVGYAGPLGERGLAAYRRAVDHRLAADPADFSAGRARQRLAVLARDVPTIIELVGRELDRPYYFRELVDALLEIGADDEALAYALRGVTVAPVAHLTIPLYDVAVRILRERGDTEEGLRLRRQQLDTFPSEQSYAALRREARDAGVWDDERLAALDVLLERDPQAWLRSLLGEGETELAWEASRDMDLDPALALALVRARAKTHPADVLGAYAALVHHTLGPTDQQAYRQGVALLGELRRAAVAAGRTADYESLVADLLEKHRRRPTLVAMLRKMPPP